MSGFLLYALDFPSGHGLIREQAVFAAEGSPHAVTMRSGEPLVVNQLDARRLIDGGRITAPRWGIFDPDTGEFDVEDKGVSPDIKVELDPAAWRQGRDPQLEKAVAVVLDRLQLHPPTPVKRPRYPVYNWDRCEAPPHHTRKEEPRPDRTKSPAVYRKIRRCLLRQMPIFRARL